MTTAVQEQKDEMAATCDIQGSIDGLAAEPAVLQLFHPMPPGPFILAKHRTSALRRVVLTGYMGAGKTTVGRLLAERIGWNFIDLDALIEDRVGRTIAEIILRDSEPAFRRIESQALAVALGRRDAVLALGGGAAESLTNRLLLEQTPATLSVFLDAPFHVLFHRCETQPAAAIRPLLANVAEAEARFSQRLPLYRRIAGLTLETAKLTPEATVDKLLTELRRNHPGAAAEQVLGKAAK